MKMIRDCLNSSIAKQIKEDFINGIDISGISKKYGFDNEIIIAILLTQDTIIGHDNPKNAVEKFENYLIGLRGLMYHHISCKSKNITISKKELSILRIINTASHVNHERIKLLEFIKNIPSEKADFLYYRFVERYTPQMIKNELGINISTKEKNKLYEELIEYMEGEVIPKSE